MEVKSVSEFLDWVAPHYNSCGNHFMRGDRVRVVGGILKGCEGYVTSNTYGFIYVKITKGLTNVCEKEKIMAFLNPKEELRKM